MSSKNLKIGDPWPFASARGITGQPCEPRWHALVTAPQKERGTRHRLQNADALVKYPTIEKTRHQRGKKRTFMIPVVPRIIYARFAYEPQWDVMKARRVVTGVFSRNGSPIVLSDDDIARVMGLPTEAERIEAERIEAMRPRVGEKAEMVDGPLKGFFIDVERVEYGRVWYSLATGIKGDAPQEMIQRVVGGR